MNNDKPIFSDNELILMWFKVQLTVLWNKIISLMQGGEPLIVDSVTSVNLERDPQSIYTHLGIHGKLRIGDEEFLTLENPRHASLLPDGAYVITKDANGAVRVQRDEKSFYFTASRYHPKEGQIVLGDQYKLQERTKSRNYVLVGGVPVMQEFLACFDMVLPVALLVTTKKENEVGIE